VRRTKPLTIELHAAFELALATALMLLPYALGLAPGSIMVGIGVGAVLAGLAISGSDPHGRGGLPVSAHAAYDWAVATGLLCAGIVLGLASGPSALIFFLAAGLAEFTLAASTSYRPTRA
jgi:hypothetical protein